MDNVYVVPVVLTETEAFMRTSIVCKSFSLERTFVYLLVTQFYLRLNMMLFCLVLHSPRYLAWQESRLFTLLVELRIVPRLLMKVRFTLGEAERKDDLAMVSW